MQFPFTLRIFAGQSTPDISLAKLHPICQTLKKTKDKNTGALSVILNLSPRQAAQNPDLKALVARKLNISGTRIKSIIIDKKSIDARQRLIQINYRLWVYLDEPAPATEPFMLRYQRKISQRRVLVIGAGPAGLFAALKLIEQGFKPIVLERGKNVKDRKADIAIINRPDTAAFINTDSNYCFGEGGAGTFSDGKLYTRSTKRGNIQDILNCLVAHGADPAILFDAHPHLGTDKLPGIIARIRNTILDAGGEIHFNTRVMDLIIERETLKGVICQNHQEYLAEAVILATGHSAHDIYELLQAKGIALESKPFAMGVRAEHPQELIDRIQYKCNTRGEYLPAATYKLVSQIDQQGVFSFCMCPGGIIVPAATRSGELVVNGMSNSRRNSPFANSGIAVTIDPANLQAFSHFGPLAGLRYQQWVEKICYEAGKGTHQAPAQRMTDFCQGKMSQSLAATSFNPGVVNAPLHELLPPEIALYLQKGFLDFGKKMKGYYTEEAMLLAPESRTSSPVRIPRHRDTFQHIHVQGLYPCGEGAGYAGGIVSSAMDGENAALALSLNLR